MLCFLININDTNILSGYKSLNTYNIVNLERVSGKRKRDYVRQTGGRYYIHLTVILACTY